MHNSERDIIDLKTPVVHTLAYIESHIQQHGEEEAEVVEGVEAGRQLWLEVALEEEGEVQAAPSTTSNSKGIEIAKHQPNKTDKIKNSFLCKSCLEMFGHSRFYAKQEFN